MVRKINCRGQVTMWIIIALIVIGSIATFFVIQRPGAILDVGRPFTPEAYLDKCVRDSVIEVVNMIMPKGGFLNSQPNILFDNVNVSYTCYINGYFDRCINQHPMYITELEEEIKSYINPIVIDCVASLRSEVRERKGKIEGGNLNIGVNLAPERIFVDLTGRTTITLGESVSTYEEFEIEILSPLYNLARVAMEISSQEARYCYFEYAGYMILHPRFDIKKHVVGNSRVYEIKDKQTEKTLNIGIRGCAIPVGL